VSPFSSVVSEWDGKANEPLGRGGGGCCVAAAAWQRRASPRATAQSTNVAEAIGEATRDAHGSIPHWSAGAGPAWMKSRVSRDSARYSLIDALHVCCRDGLVARQLGVVALGITQQRRRLAEVVGLLLHRLPPDDQARHDRVPRLLELLGRRARAAASPLITSRMLAATCCTSRPWFAMPKTNPIDGPLEQQQLGLRGHG
jgi:hypothetical protein